MISKTPDRKPAHGFESELEQRRAIVAQIHELLERAEVRRRDEPHRRRKWNRVLDNLERGLAEARARVAVLEPLAEAAASVNSDPPSDDDKALEEPKEGDEPSASLDSSTEKEGEEGRVEQEEGPASSENGLSSPQTPGLIDTPLWAEMEATLEEFGRGRAHAGTGEDEEEHYEAARLLDARGEFQSHPYGPAKAKQERAGGSSEYSEAERSRLAVLCGAIEKLKNGAFASLSFEEAELALRCYIVLETRLFLNERDTRLKVILKQGLSGIAHYSERLANRVRDAYNKT